jgi:hypothetical protein
VIEIAATGISPTAHVNSSPDAFGARPLASGSGLARTTPVIAEPDA